jgi:predicted MFS family arabinose efflux permease
MTPERITEEIGIFKTIFVVASAICASLTGYIVSNIEIFNIKIFSAILLMLAFFVVTVYSFYKMKVLVKKL